MEQNEKTAADGITQLNLDVEAKGFSNKNLTAATRGYYNLVARAYNRFLRRNNLVVSLESVQQWFDSNPDWKHSTCRGAKSALLYYIEHQPGQNGIIKAAALQILFNRMAPRAKSDEAITADKFLTREQINILKETIPLRIALLVEFQFQTCTRVSEIKALRLQDCRLSQNEKFIHIALKGGGGSKHAPREVFCTPELYNAIRQEYNAKVFLFERRPGLKMVETTYVRTLRQIYLRTGFMTSTHKIRHSGAMHILKRMEERGKGARALIGLSKYLGNSNLSVTANFYGKVTLEGQEVMELFAEGAI